jgi:hypothetical protein
MSSRFVRLCYKNWPFVSSGRLLYGPREYMTTATRKI